MPRFRAERNLAAGRQADEIQRHRLFEAITLRGSIRSQSSMSCRASSPTGVGRGAQCAGIHRGPRERGEGWVASGMTRLART